MYYKFLLIFVGIVLLRYDLSAQESINSFTPLDSLIVTSDSAVSDTIIYDPLTPVSVRRPGLTAVLRYQDSLKNTLHYPVFDLQESMTNYRRSDKIPQYQEGTAIARGEHWIITALLLLLVFFAFLKRVFDKQLTLIMQSFFSNRVLSNINKEDNLFTAWPFLLLFVQFGFTIGLFLYLAARQQPDFDDQGIKAFFSFSAAVVLLYAFKIIVLRLLGFFFNVQKPVNEYVSILYLSYFNASFLFIPLVTAFALSPAAYGKFYIAMAIILLLIIFVFQLIRAGITVLSQNRFSKVYLFLYFCTLEICPILILIKAIGF